VVSGKQGAVDELIERASRLGAKRTVKLRVSGAFHSPLVAKAAERLKPAVDRVRFADPVGIDRGVKTISVNNVAGLKKVEESV
jgi:malonyl CoA-acyl carrier protein transacylase